MARKRYYFSDKLAARRSRNFKIGLAALLIIAVSAGSAWSSNLAVPASLSYPSSATDVRLPLLKSVRHITSPDVVADEDQRPAGTLAVPSQADFSGTTM